MKRGILLLALAFSYGSAFAGGDWRGGGEGNGGWYHPYPPSPSPYLPPPPPPPPTYQDLCAGTYWGQYSNGVPATLALYHNGWNRVNVVVQVKGGWTFTGQGTCDQYGQVANLYFWIQGPGTGPANNSAHIQSYGNSAYVSGNQEGGLSYSFSR